MTIHGHLMKIDEEKKVVTEICKRNRGN